MPAYTPIEVIVSTDLPSVVAVLTVVEVVANTSLSQLVVEIQPRSFTVVV